jgi:hypothetical protein
MGKILNLLKKYSLGSYKTGLYNNNTMTFGSLLSVILSILFLLGLMTGIGIYFNEIFIKRPLHIEKQESIEFKDTKLSRYSLLQSLEIFPDMSLTVILENATAYKCTDL